MTLALVGAESNHTSPPVVGLGWTPLNYLSQGQTPSGERVWQIESLFRQSKMGVAEMGVVTMLKLVGYYLYSRTDLERFSVLEITFLVDVYRNLS